MRLELAIRDVVRAEGAVARKLAALGERHRADHDVFHLAHTLQRLAGKNLAALEPHARRYGVASEPEAGGAAEGGGSGEAEGGVALLRDLHLANAAASIDWVVLGQGAQAARDAQLLATVSACHAQTLRGLKWTVTRMKTAAPQALMS